MAKKKPAKRVKKSSATKPARKVAKRKKPNLEEQVAIDLRTGTPPDRVAERHQLSSDKLKSVQQKLVNPAAGKRGKK